MGIPVGSDLEYADEVTMMKAMEGRRDLLGCGAILHEEAGIKRGPTGVGGQPPLSRPAVQRCAL